MWYFIHARDNPDSLELRSQHRPAHLERLHALQDQGRLLTAGPLPAIDAEDPGPAGFTGSLIVAAFESLEAAQAWAVQDPFLIAGVYGSVDVYPYKAALPA